LTASTSETSSQKSNTLATTTPTVARVTGSAIVQLPSLEAAVRVRAVPRP
jgi:hypothetical protein